MNAAFTLTAGCNPWLADGDTAFDAAVTVACDTGGPSTAEVAEVIVIDRSGSMAGPKIAQAKRAAKAAVGALRDGAHFSVVAGATEAVPQYPLGGGLARADDRTRRAACAAVDAMSEGSLTSIGQWLRCAADLLATRPDAIGQVLLLTDGRGNQSPDEYRADLDYCRGKFTCHSVGIGLDWDVDELAHLAERFQGTFKFCEDLADLPDHFTELSLGAMAKAAADVELRVYLPEGTELKALHQMHPVKQDLVHRRPIGGRGWAFPLAPWGSEEREYLLRLVFPPTEVDDRRALRIGLWRDGEMLVQERLQVRWTEERTRFLAIDPQVAALLGQSELSERIDAAMRALDRGDLATATQAARRAYELAEDGGFDGMMGTLARLAVYDPETRSVQVRQDLDETDRKAIGSQRYVTESSPVILSRKGNRS